jgi:Na+-driven multidrug efflux pump
MKRLIKNLTFISLGIIGASVMAVLLCCVFRVPLMELFFHRGQELPAVIPVANAVTLVGQLGAMIWLCICVGNRRFGIWS